MAQQERLVVSITVTPEERERIQALAQRRGYAAPDDYLRALIASDAQQHGDAAPFEEDDEEDVDSVEAFREGWHDAMTGKTYPVSALWDDLVHS